jgi:hypothetical protein
MMARQLVALKAPVLVSSWVLASDLLWVPLKVSALDLSLVLLSVLLLALRWVLPSALTSVLQWAG